MTAKVGCLLLGAQAHILCLEGVVVVVVVGRGNLQNEAFFFFKFPPQINLHLSNGEGYLVVWAVCSV